MCIRDSPKRDAPAKNWCFTFNNYSEDDYNKLLSSDTFNINGSNGSKYIIGKEIGESGTPHLQGYIEFSDKLRLTQLKKMFDIRIHWEKCRGSRDDNLKYCSKEGNYTTLGIIVPKPIKIIDKLRPWQSSIVDLYNTEPNGRSVNWYFDNVGNSGKSTFCKYMFVKYGVMTIQGGKLADIINIIFNMDMSQCKMLLIDVPRNNKNNISYSAIECILNGMITNTKYETGIKVFNPPHVVVFCNYQPEYEKLSHDRWIIREIIGNYSLDITPTPNELEDMDLA
jgi:hypothetical protein